MPETYGMPEPEVPRSERASALATEAIAGQSVVRTVLLYVGIGVVAGLTAYVPPMALLAIGLLVLLMASDRRLG